MVHETVLLFSKERLDEEKIYEILKICFTDQDGYSTIDGYSGILEFPYVPETVKDKSFLQLSDLWSLNEWDIADNINLIITYITIDNELKYATGEDILVYAHSLPETTWIARLWIAP